MKFTFQHLCMSHCYLKRVDVYLKREREIIYRNIPNFSRKKKFSDVKKRFGIRFHRINPRFPPLEIHLSLTQGLDTLLRQYPDYTNTTTHGSSAARILTMSTKKRVWFRSRALPPLRRPMTPRETLSVSVRFHGNNVRH